MFQKKVVFRQNLELQTSKQILNSKTVDGIDIVFENIKYSVNIIDKSVKSSVPCKQATKNKEILKGISGILKAGQITVIMGASGAGKTTLLNILSCRIKAQQGGKLYANNLEYNYKSFGDFANYVMQTDVLMQSMTVRQTLNFAAKLKLNVSQEQRKEKVKILANEMKLQKCLDTLVGGIILKGVSGGQKKRTSIAFELISDPQVIFLDEPTSGLDSLTSYIICSKLKKLAKNENKTVIMTIHQPNSETYELFDQLLLLLQGCLIYHNKSQLVNTYFQQTFGLICPQYTNVSDFIMSKIHHEDKKNVKRFPQYFEAYQKHQKPNIDYKMTKKLTSQVTFREINVGFITSLNVLIHRSVLHIIRNPTLMRTKISQIIFMALLVGGIYFNIGAEDYTQKGYWLAITGYMFFLTIYSMLRTILTISSTFSAEREIFCKERNSKMYNVVQYFMARNIVQLPQLIIVSFIFVSINYFMVGMANTGGQFFLHCLIFGLMSFSGASVGLLIGSAILDSKSVPAVVPVITFPFLLFSGLYKNRADLPRWIGWIEYLSPNKYGFIALLQNQVQFRDSNIEQLNFDITKWEAVVLLLCLGILYRLLALLFLWALRKRSQ